jgi:hypothetical protein
MRFFFLEIQPLLDILRRIVGLETFPVLSASVLFLPHQTVDLYIEWVLFIFFFFPSTSSAIAIGFERNWRKKTSSGIRSGFFFPLLTRRPACKEAKEEEKKQPFGFVV